MSRFDRLEARLHKATTRTFGYDATWLPSVGGVALSARVHFKDPNKYSPNFENEMRKVDYGRRQIVMEYYEGEFPALYELVDNGSDSETVTIFIKNQETPQTFRVSAVDKIHDGHTYAAFLVEVPTTLSTEG